jgi:hypothetical protein
VCCWNSFPALNSCTISGNSEAGGGGVYCRNSPTATLSNCIVWGEPPNSDCEILSHCLTEQDPRFVRKGVFNFTGSVSMLVGGQTVWLPAFIVEEPDFHLLPGSPAIDAGILDGAPEADIEGTPRPQGVGCDIGAYEYSGPVPVPFIRGEVNGDGNVDLSDAVAVLGYLFLGSEEPGCLKSADTNDTGALDLTDPVYLLGFLFLGGPSPPGPHPECGVDRTKDDLGCESSAPCEG